MKKSLFLVIILVSVIMLTIQFLANPVFNFALFKEKAGIRILSNPIDAQVFLDDSLVGRTPYENTELKPKDYTIKIQSDKTSWQGRVKLNKNTLTLVGRDLSEDSLSSAGENLSLEPGKGVTIISFPVGANINIDGKFIGKTPFWIDNLEIGEHIFSFSLDGFSTRSVKASVRENFNLIVSVDLALMQSHKPDVQSSLPKIMSNEKPKNNSYKKRIVSN
ncbi:MAG: Serine/threonine-protein kinase [Microgenomates group bacterium Gr01-1014_93]|nr:MAG: Serine/threonine-protein kinase [Microgenomates group bacterium Gr01-1014_93]